MFKVNNKDTRTTPTSTFMLGGNYKVLSHD